MKLKTVPVYLRTFCGEGFDAKRWMKRPGFAAYSLLSTTNCARIYSELNCRLIGS